MVRVGIRVMAMVSIYLSNPRNQPPLVSNQTMASRERPRVYRYTMTPTVDPLYNEFKIDFVY